MLVSARAGFASLPGPRPTESRPFFQRAWIGVVLGLALWGLSTTAALAEGPASYRVQAGDTLTGISARFGVPVSELVALNGLANANYVRAGQTLTVGGASVAVRATSRGNLAPLIAAPYIRQFDGSVFADSNCGPTSLTMALGAVGIRSDPITLRHLADRQMGFENPADGTTWDALAFAARASGGKVSGLYSGRHDRVWTVDDVHREFSLGHPVILLVRYRDLPDHRGSPYWGDHYIVGLGFDAAGNLVYNDPAFRVGSGARRTMSQAEFLRAWTSTSVRLTRTAMAIAR